MAALRRANLPTRRSRARADDDEAGSSPRGRRRDGRERIGGRRDGEARPRRTARRRRPPPAPARTPRRAAQSPRPRRRDRSRTRRCGRRIRGGACEPGGAAQRTRESPSESPPFDASPQPNAEHTAARASLAHAADSGTPNRTPPAPAPTGRPRAWSPSPIAAAPALDRARARADRLRKRRRGPRAGPAADTRCRTGRAGRVEPPRPKSRHGRAGGWWSRRVLGKG